MQVISSDILGAVRDFSSFDLDRSALEGIFTHER